MPLSISISRRWRRVAVHEHKLNRPSLWNPQMNYNYKYSGRDEVSGALVPLLDKWMLYLFSGKWGKKAYDNKYYYWCDVPQMAELLRGDDSGASVCNHVSL